MKPFLTALDCSMTKFKYLNTWVKKNRKFGAYIEVEETDTDKYTVSLFCERMHTDKYGNRALRQARMMLDEV